MHCVGSTATDVCAVYTTDVCAAYMCFERRPALAALQLCGPAQSVQAVLCCALTPCSRVVSLSAPAPLLPAPSALANRVAAPPTPSLRCTCGIWHPGMCWGYTPRAPLRMAATLTRWSRPWSHSTTMAYTDQGVSKVNSFYPDRAVTVTGTPVPVLVMVMVVPAGMKVPHSMPKMF